MPPAGIASQTRPSFRCTGNDVINKLDEAYGWAYQARGNRARNPTSSPNPRANRTMLDWAGCVGVVVDRGIETAELDDEEPPPAQAVATTLIRSTRTTCRT